MVFEVASLRQTTRTRVDRRDGTRRRGERARGRGARARARVARADCVSVESFGDARRAVGGGVDARARWGRRSVASSDGRRGGAPRTPPAREEAGRARGPARARAVDSRRAPEERARGERDGGERERGASGGGETASERSERDASDDDRRASWREIVVEYMSKRSNQESLDAVELAEGLRERCGSWSEETKSALGVGLRDFDRETLETLHDLWRRGYVECKDEKFLASRHRERLAFRRKFTLAKGVAEAMREMASSTKTTRTLSNERG